MAQTFVAGLGAGGLLATATGKSDATAWIKNLERHLEHYVIPVAAACGLQIPYTRGDGGELLNRLLGALISRDPTVSSRDSAFQSRGSCVLSRDPCVGMSTTETELSVVSVEMKDLEVEEKVRSEGVERGRGEWRVPVEREVVTVKQLLKLKNCFHVQLFPNTNAHFKNSWMEEGEERREEGEEASGLVDEEEKERKRRRKREKEEDDGGEEMKELPVVLVGVLVTRGRGGGGGGREMGGLMIKDASGEIQCEVRPPVDIVCSVVLVKKCNLLCYNKSSEHYLEVDVLIQLFPLHRQPSPINSELDSILTVVHLLQRMKGLKSRRTRLRVAGQLTAISQPMLNGTDSYLVLIQLAQHNNEATFCHIILECPDLMYLPYTIKLFEVYIFTELRVVIMNKGKTEETKVCALSSDSDVIRVTPDHTPFLMDQLSSLAPPSPSSSSSLCKRLRREDKEREREAVTPSSTSAYLTHLSPSLLSPSPISPSPLSPSSLSPPPLSSPLISYKGSISRLVLPEAGVYELDGRVLMYMTHLSTCGRGGVRLRVGCVVEAHHMHLLRITVPQWKHLSGFYCCSLSRIEIVSFSKKKSDFKPYISQNKLAHLLRQYNAEDSAWLVSVFLSLQKKFSKLRTCYTVLSALCSTQDLPHTTYTSHSGFLSHPHSCGLLGGETVLYQRPLVPTLCTVMGACSGGGGACNGGGGARSSVLWQSCNEGVGSGGVGVGSGGGDGAMWSFGVVENSCSDTPKMLVGTIKGNPISGQLELHDRTAVIPLVAPVLPYRQGRDHRYVQPLYEAGRDQGYVQPLCGADGDTVAISKYTLFAERTTREDLGGRNDVCVYLYCSKVQVLTENQQEALVAPSKNPVLYLLITKKNALKTSDSAHTFTSQAKVHTQLEVLQHLSNHTPNYVSTATNACTIQAATTTVATSTPPAVSVAVNFTSACWYPHIHTGYIYCMQLSSGSYQHNPPPTKTNQTHPPPTKPILDQTRPPPTKTNQTHPPPAKPTLNHTRPPCTLAHLRKDPSITVDDGITMRVVGVCTTPTSYRFLPSLLEVEEVTSKLFLPKLNTLASITAQGQHSAVQIKPSFEGGVVSFRGLVVEHSYRIDYDTMSAGRVALRQSLAKRSTVSGVSNVSGVSTVSGVSRALGSVISTTSGISRTDTTTSTSNASNTVFNATNTVFNATDASIQHVVALCVKSLQRPDSFMVYCHYKHNEPRPLGLLPGAIATFHSFSLKSSRSGNVYCVNSAGSSISIESMDYVGKGDAFDQNQIKSDQKRTNFDQNNTTHNKTISVYERNKIALTHDIGPSLPLSYLYDLTRSLLYGTLSRSVVCIRATVMAVQQASLQFQCVGCKCTAVEGVCMVACVLRKCVLKGDARLLVQDGSGEAHLYVQDSTLPLALGLTQKEWSDLQDTTYHVGRVAYTKSSSTIMKLSSERSEVTVGERAQRLFQEVLTRQSLHRTLTIHCQPFLSPQEHKETVIGQKTHMVRAGRGRDYSTLSLPRLQLRAVGVAVGVAKSMNNISLCRTLLADLEQQL